MSAHAQMSEERRRYLEGRLQWWSRGFRGSEYRQGQAIAACLEVGARLPAESLSPEQSVLTRVGEAVRRRVQDVVMIYPCDLVAAMAAAELRQAHGNTGGN